MQTPYPILPRRAVHVSVFGFNILPPLPNKWRFESPNQVSFLPFCAIKNQIFAKANLSLDNVCRYSSPGMSIIPAILRHPKVWNLNSRPWRARDLPPQSPNPKPFLGMSQKQPEVPPTQVLHIKAYIGTREFEVYDRSPAKK